MTAYHNAQNMRLEVEIPTTGLPNLVKNPGGEKGAWWWQTPVANTSMSVYGNSAGLQFTTASPQACNFTTDFMPVAATKYVAARFDIVTITSSHNLKVTFDWYNSAKVLLSSSAQSGALATIGTNYVAAAQAPASTAYVKARFNFYNGTGNANGNAWVALTKAMVTWANTSAGLGSSRTNLVPNPSFETNTTGWQCALQHTIATSTAQAAVGTSSLAITKNGSGFTTVVFTDLLTITGGGTYSLGFSSRAATTARSMQVRAAWYDAGGTNISSTTVTLGSNSASAWTTFTATFTAPSNATGVRLYPEWLSPNIGETHYLDAVILEQASTPGTYFDGATTDTASLDYSWTGTAHASPSTETTLASTFAYAEPNGWRNILGPTFEMSSTREALNLGTFTAKITDPLLDPAETDDVRPGKLIRLQSLIGGAWESVYEGKLTNAHVDYEKAKDPGAVEKTVITLTAVDNIATLANRGESRGLPTIASLPYILEDKAVPWNCNGSTGQVTSATQVSSNENASALDQVAITRDSVLGYAWVDRKNTLNVWDSSKLLGGNSHFANPGFEVDASGWQVIGLGGGTLTRTTAQFHSGVASGQLTSGGTNSAQIYPHDGTNFLYFACTPGGQYTVEVWTKAATTARPVYFRINATRANSTTYLLDSTGSNNSTSGWTKHSYTFTVDATTTKFYVTLRIPDAVASEVHYVDDFFMNTASVIYTDVPVSSQNFSSYSSINVDFDTERCINEVSVKWLRYDPSTGETEEIPYGPYKDQASIDAWGPFSSEFTVHGSAESSGTIAAYASSILAANSTPERRANSITVPVLDARSFWQATQIDLYALVHVTYGTKVDEDYRVTGIQHQITPEKWTTTYSFDVTGSVASPQMTPSPPAIDAPYDPTRFVAGQSAIVGTAPPAGKLKIIKEGTAVTTVANTAGGFGFSYVGGAFPNGIVTCVVMVGDNTGNFGQIVTVSGNMTLSAFNGVAVQRNGTVVANGTAIRVNYIAVGW